MPGPHTSPTDRFALRPATSQLPVPCPPTRFRLTFSAPAAQRVEGHLPFLRRADRLSLASGEAVELNSTALILPWEKIGDHFTFAGLRVSVPAGSHLRWPVAIPTRVHLSFSSISRTTALWMTRDSPYLGG